MSLMSELPSGLPIGEGWVPARAHEPVRFPFDGSVIGQSPIADEVLASSALDAALAVEQIAFDLPSRTRNAILMRAHDQVSQRRSDLEELLVLGHPARAGGFRPRDERRPCVEPEVDQTGGGCRRHHGRAPQAKTQSSR